MWLQVECMEREMGGDSGIMERLFCRASCLAIIHLPPNLLQPSIGLCSKNFSIKSMSIFYIQATSFCE